MDIISVVGRCAMTLVALSVVSYATADDWRQFGGPNRNFQLQRASGWNERTAFSVDWRQSLGEGMSGFVSDGELLYTSYLAASPDGAARSGRKMREAIVGLDRQGKLVWKREYDAKFVEAQQVFGGRSRAPQATPCIFGDRLCCIGFSGVLHVVNRFNGQLEWSMDLVERFEAVPVSFGFSASPIPHGDRLIVLAGGRKGGLLCLDGSNGEVIWNVVCDEASYATPIVWECRGEKQVVFVTRKSIQGVALDDGVVRWEYSLPQTGLTNVPTPLIVDDQSLVVSGQGIGGTRRIRPVPREERWEVEELWESGEQFFYCNWILRNGIIFGSDGKLLNAMDAQTGQRLGRWRGFADANLLSTEDAMFVLDGKGWLHAMEFSHQDALYVRAKVQVLDARCWTPPTLLGQQLICRGGDQVVCVSLGTKADSQLPPGRIFDQTLTWAATGDDTPVEFSPVEQVRRAYERGEEAAWNQYQRLRRANQLTTADIVTLLEMARGEGLHNVAEKLERHAHEPVAASRPSDDALPEKVTLETETHRGDNGLLYLQLGVRNRSQTTIQAVVQGPKRHPFGYGLPLRPGVIRKENWPVGTTLYRAHDESRGKVLLVVKESDAGNVVDIP